VTTARRVHYTYAEYLSALEVSDVKLEYCDGEIYAMAGGTPLHAELRIEATDLTTFPDASVVCGEQELSPVDPHGIKNPSLLFEVTSKSTEDYDRGEKLNHYKQIAWSAGPRLVTSSSAPPAP
jgi:Uma2 family endonuclease